MNQKKNKSDIKKLKVSKSIRIGPDLQKKATDILTLANKKNIGRKVKIEKLLSLALDLITEDHIKKLQDLTLTNEDRKELLRQKWILKHGPTSKEEFTGIMMTKVFFEFLENLDMKDEKERVVS